MSIREEEGDLWNFIRKISTFRLLGMAVYMVEKEIEIFRQ